MKQLFQENRNAFLLLLALLFILLISLYFLFYRPLADELQQTKHQEETLQEELTLLEAQIHTGEERTEEIENMQLERRVPRLPELEALLLTLNEIEVMSNSQISDMSFGYQGGLPERPIIEEEPEDEEESEISDAAASEIEIEGIETTTETLDSPTAFTEMPAGLQPVIVTLEVESPDYEHFQSLLKEIEKQERMMIVTNVDFDQSGESAFISAEEPTEAITATLVVSTFYFE